MSAACFSDPGLYFVPLGGAGEIGMNLNLYGILHQGRESWIAVDVGVTFGDTRTPGVDLIMADISFIEERRDKLLGIVLTHGHEDHVGALAALWPRLEAPVYATPFTAALIKSRLLEAGIYGRVPMHVVPLGSGIRLDPFKIELITLTHSIPEPNGLAIRTPLGNILHTGDWKIDPDPVIGETTDEEALKRLGAEGVLAMVCDSTNVFEHGEAGSEADVEGAMHDAIGGCEGRVFVTSFASNVARLETIARAAQKHGRRVALAGRSMRRIVGAAQDTGYLQGLPPFLSEEQGAAAARGKILFLCTGSQGVPESALPRIAMGTHRVLRMSEGDRIIFSSREIPGNEKDIARLYNLLAERGVEVLTPKHDPKLHISGHPCRDELASMYRWVRPKIAIPVHGERRHMKEHASLARDLQVPLAIVPTNGAIIHLAPGEASQVGGARNGRLYLDGQILLPADHKGIMREREELAKNGVLAVSLMLDADGFPLDEAMVSFCGIPGEDAEGVEMREHVLDAIDEAFELMEKQRTRRREAVHKMLKRFILNVFRRRWGKIPYLHLHIQRVDDG